MRALGEPTPGVIQDCDLVTCHLDDAARLPQELVIPTVRFHTPRSGSALHHDNPDADEAVPACAGSDARPFTVLENSQNVIGEFVDSPSLTRSR